MFDVYFESVQSTFSIELGQPQCSFPVSHEKKTEVVSYTVYINPFHPSVALQIKWLVSIWNARLGWNCLIKVNIEAAAGGAL